MANFYIYFSHRALMIITYPQIKTGSQFFVMFFNHIDWTSLWPFVQIHYHMLSKSRRCLKPEPYEDISGDCGNILCCYVARRPEAGRSETTEAGIARRLCLKLGNCCPPFIRSLLFLPFFLLILFSCFWAFKSLLSRPPTTMESHKGLNFPSHSNTPPTMAQQSLLPIAHKYKHYGPHLSTQLIHWALKCW